MINVDSIIIKIYLFNDELSTDSARVCRRSGISLPKFCVQLVHTRFWLWYLISLKIRPIYKAVSELKYRYGISHLLDSVPNKVSEE